uniref:Carboxylic ester hydrolase n=1 Tax=Pieris rapae TaxID=64459 RepID=A0A1U9X1Y2_PIERA|nr:carboxylesterase [Pieris rapae]
MIKLRRILIALMAVAFSEAHLPTLPIRISSGLLRGTVALDNSHVRYHGIPYAVANRFESPKPAPKWVGILDAINEYSRCPQRFLSFVIGNEDCLTLNVYAPIKRRNRPYPVMVFIHGGGFRDGSGSPYIYGPEFLVNKNIILVTLNYRLEVLGFLCLGIKEAQGNMGLKDQVEALRWVRKNIIAFGGDPDNVTIFGESAGSASVLYHILSPMSKGLFHKAILESGSAMSFWATQFNPKDIAFRFAQQLKYNTTDVYEVLDIFKMKTAAELLSTRVPRSNGNIVQSENIFVPCIETSIPGTESFLTDSPYVVLNSGKFNKVPVIIGFNNAEGYMFVGKENKTTKAMFNFLDSLPRDLQFPDNSARLETAENLKNIYSSKENSSDVSEDSLVKYEGDAGIRFPVVSTTDLLIRNSGKPVFSYKFSYSGLLNLVKILYGFGTSPGASHGDEIPYLFKVEGFWPIATLEMKMIEKMTTMWSNFAKYSNPTPFMSALLPVKWEPASPKKPKQLVINTHLTTAPLWEDEALLLWNETYSKYRKLN